MTTKTAFGSDLEAGKDATKSAKGNNDFYSRLNKIIFCFVGLQLSYVSWGLVQEYLMTHTYTMGKFKSSTFLVFANRFLALIISLGIVAFQKFSNPSKSTMKEIPFYYYAPSSLSNTISSWAQYEALRYVSFPTQVLSKSCKIIPVMLVGFLLNKKSYPWSEYVEAALITAGVFVFTISEKPSKESDHGDTTFGIGLLLLYLFCDSFTSQWQSRVYKQFGIDQYQMMLGVNVWSMIMTGITLAQSGEFFSSLAFILADSSAFFHMMILSLTSATGQLFIFYTIKELGPVIFTIMMTTRQIFSLVVSCIVFAHSLSWAGWASSLAVFGVVFNRIYRKGSD